MATQTITKPKIILKNGKPSEVILRWRDFQELLEKIEDVYDFSEIKKMKKKKLIFKDLTTFLKEHVL
jgi:hypothetical protein